MIPELSSFAARLRGAESALPHFSALPNIGSPSTAWDDGAFNALALELFSLQFSANRPYRTLCESRGLNPANVRDWTQIPAAPAAAFKEFEMTCLAPAERTVVFHSSGTTGQTPSRHFHCAESLALYEASLWVWFRENFRFTNDDLRAPIFLTPPEQAPHSSLVHMFEAIRQRLGAQSTGFVGQVDSSGAWTLDFDAALAALSPRAASPAPQALLLLGTAFSFVHLLDYLVGHDLRLRLPPGTRVMETGGYKGRSRVMPKAELHELITERLGVPASHIVCEYGMSELSSQAYDGEGRRKKEEGRSFRFPPWARVQVVSPETGKPVGDGESGLLRVFDLANVFSVMVIQTEDLAVRRGDGFELLGRAQVAEPRGCSLMTA
jgi:hypothetical protein